VLLVVLVFDDIRFDNVFGVFVFKLSSPLSQRYLIFNSGLELVRISVKIISDILVDLNFIKMIMVYNLWLFDTFK